jgi:hypothetical protein
LYAPFVLEEFSLYLESISWCILLLHLKMPTTTTSSMSIIFEKLTELVEFASKERLYSPSTLRLITPSSNSSPTHFLSEWESSTYYCSFPSIRTSPEKSLSLLAPKERKRHAFSRTKLFSFLTILVIQSQNDFEAFKDSLRQTIDPRRDTLIFLTDTNNDSHTVLRNIRSYPGIRHKYLMDARGDPEEGLLWVEPEIYSGDMITVQSPSLRKEMGYNLRGRHLLASAPETPPFNFKSGVDSQGKPIVDGSLCRIFVEASKKFNFSYEITYEWIDYGTLHENGTWTGSYSKVHYPDSGYDLDLIVSHEILWTQLDVGMF